MDAEDGTGEVSRRACISGTDGSACCLPDVLAGNVVLKGLRLINRAYREDIVISSASPIHSEGMGGVIDYFSLLRQDDQPFLAFSSLLISWILLSVR